MINKYVSKEGKFIAPYRLPNESKKDYNKRYTDAQIASGLYPRIARASTVGTRADERFVKLNDLKIEKVNSKIEKLRIAAKNDPSQAYNLTNAINKLQIQSNKLNDIKLTDKRYERYRSREDLQIQESQKEATEFNAGATDRQRKAENQRISDEYRAEQANKDPWMPNQPVGYQVDGINQPGMNLGSLTISANVNPAVNDSNTDTSISTTEVTPKTDKSVEKVEQSPKDKWLQDTARSPAAKAGLSEEMRWAARQNHLKWKKDKKNKKKLGIASPMDMD